MTTLWDVYKHNDFDCTAGQLLDYYTRALNIQYIDDLKRISIWGPLKDPDFKDTIPIEPIYYNRPEFDE